MSFTKDKRSVLIFFYSNDLSWQYKCRIINVKDSLNAIRQSRAEEVSYTNYFFSKDYLSKNLFPIFAPFIFLPFNMFFHNRVSFLSNRALIKKTENYSEINAAGLI